MSEAQSRYIIEEDTRECAGIPGCLACGSITRHTVDLRLGRIPVESFADLCRQYSRRWPGALVERIADGYRFIGHPACGCYPTPEAEGTGQ